MLQELKAAAGRELESSLSVSRGRIGFRFRLLAVFLVSATSLVAQDKASPAAWTTPPIDNIVVYIGPIPQKITANSAEIWWVTSVPTHEVVKYGTSKKHLTNEYKDENTFRSGHSVVLRNLHPDTTYYFSVLRSDETDSAEGVFKTRAPGYQKQKRIEVVNGPAIDKLTSGVANIEWRTNREATSTVHYGTDPQHLDQSATGAPSLKYHQVEIHGLKPATQYYFCVSSAAVQGAWKPVMTPAFPFFVPETNNTAPYAAMQP